MSTQAVAVAEFISVETYNATKDWKTSVQKDELINTLLNISCIHDYMNDIGFVSEKHTCAVSQWADSSTNRADSSHVFIRKLNGSIQAKHPDFVGFEFHEFVLMTMLKQIDASNITIYSEKSNKERLTCWIVCVKKDYDILDKASRIVNDYQRKYKATVELGFLGLSQYDKGCAPQFVYSI